MEMNVLARPESGLKVYRYRRNRTNDSYYKSTLHRTLIKNFSVGDYSDVSLRLKQLSDKANHIIEDD